jgi:GWxTD domain-containing protein
MRVNKTIIFALIIIAFTGCAIPTNYYLLKGYDMTNKEMVKNFTKYIITNDEQVELDLVKNDKEIENFLVKFWAKRDITPLDGVNQFKNTYVERFIYANNNLDGCQTDMARVYLLYGAPDEILKKTMPNYHLDFEIWVYDKSVYRPDLENTITNVEYGKVKFAFYDRMGFGIKEQVYSTEDGEKTDPRFYQIQLENGI